MNKEPKNYEFDIEDDDLIEEMIMDDIIFNPPTIDPDTGLIEED